ncbi:TPA: hypothetical protein N0F65_006886 [Lagenidium giganteum]|uniref:PX domain-containing protein n=1 Tax=Lagenidium giganteum TaxID=4803 RepID=A0AAV2ZH28_9STRA|nr:TPA: hypothetical protein N0F65_006886 [Lagenidium giganteum]
MGKLTLEQIQRVIADPYTELQVPIGSPPEQIAAAFRAICLQATLNTHPNADHDPYAFQRQAVAYRFLYSIPLMDDHEYQPDEIFARLRPVDAYSGDESNERASPMLEISIGTMEMAQRKWELPYTNYVITVHYCLRKHVVRRRYNEFVVLHEMLEKRLPVLPTLPERHWKYRFTVGSDRAMELTKYLSRIIETLAHRGLYSMEIMAFLEIDYSKVRAEEEALAVDFLSRVGSSNVFYIIHDGWLNAWKKFVSLGKITSTNVNKEASKSQSDNQQERNSTNATEATKAAAEPHVEAAPAKSAAVLAAEAAKLRPGPPGKITNTHLINPQTNAPKDLLVAGKHYRCVNYLVWQYFVQVYGGGPRLLRKEPNIYTTNVYDMNTLAVLLQKLVRGYLGRLRAKRRRHYMLHQDPAMEKKLQALVRKMQMEEHMNRIRKFVKVKEFQIQHVAAVKVQRAFRAHVLRVEHKLLMNESAVPTVAENFQNIEEYYSLEEIGLIRDPRYRLAHFIVTMNKGVPIQKMRSRKKTPKWRLFKINPIGSQLMWSSKKRTRTVSFIECTSVTIESPLVFKNAFGRKKNTVYDYAVVLTYGENNQTHELVMVCESYCDCEALHFGLNALIQETKGRVSDGGSYVDGHGIIRKKVPHAKRLIREAKEIMDQQQGQANPAHIRMH